jgi:hypothetical protein
LKGCVCVCACVCVRVACVVCVACGVRAMRVWGQGMVCEAIGCALQGSMWNAPLPPPSPQHTHTHAGMQHGTDTRTARSTRAPAVMWQSTQTARPCPAPHPGARAPT